MEELDHLGFAGCFNFLYLPIDSATKNNVGYAFVNFNDEKTADDCLNNMSGYFFKGQPYNRRRAAIVSVAHLQGLEANLEHYSRTQA
jgi:RNA recognition motif-containing protein